MKINILGFFRQTIPVMGNSRIIRITSIILEPSYLSFIISPALFFYLSNHRKKNEKIRLYIFLLTLFLTFSTTGYLVFFFMLFYLLYKRFHLLKYFLILLMGIMMFAFFSSHENIEKNTTNVQTSVFSDIVMKVDESIKSFSDMRPQTFELLNLSTYAWMSNLWVSINAPNRLCGTGLGSHAESYYRLYKSNFYYYGLNSQDAYSFGIRVFSEFGFLGMFLIIMSFLFMFNNKNIINESVSFYLITGFIRGGNYFLYGFIFFVLLFIFTRRKNDL